MSGKMLVPFWLTMASCPVFCAMLSSCSCEIVVECLRCWLIAVHCVVQLWCAAGVNVTGWQDVDSPASPGDHSLSTAGHSADSTSPVCQTCCWKKFCFWTCELSEAHLLFKTRLASKSSQFDNNTFSMFRIMFALLMSYWALHLPAT